MDKLNPKHKGFYDIMESIAYSYPNQKQLIFGWSSEITTMNSIAIRTISPLPNVIVINSTTLQYYLIENELNAQNIITFLDYLIQMSPKLKESPNKLIILLFYQNFVNRLPVAIGFGTEFSEWVTTRLPHWSVCIMAILC